MGLSEIIRLRGGFGAVNYNPVIQFSIDRYLLSLYQLSLVNILMYYSLNFSSLLVTKLWIPIYNSSIWKAPVFPAELTNLYHSQGMLCVDGLVESDLAIVFYNLQYTTILFNKHYYDKTPVNGMFIRQCLGFVHSSLIELEGRFKNNVSECLRLGMMAFLATTFRLQGSYEQYYCKSLSNKLQLSHAAAKASNPDLPEAMSIWLILLLLISTGDIDKLHTCVSWEGTAASGLSWNEIRRYLKQIMWIDSVHDDLGTRAFETLMTRIGLLDM
jgi:hypothetical protein